MVHLTLVYYRMKIMTSVAPTLSKEDRSISHSLRSILLGKFRILRRNNDNSAGRIYDDGALIHILLAWPKDGTMGSVCETFVGYAQASAAPDVHVCVVFDSYDRQTTKAPEQKRRRLKTGSYPDVVLEGSTPVPGNKQAFIGNMINKQHMICMLSAHLEWAGVAGILARCRRRRGC